MMPERLSACSGERRPGTVGEPGEILGRKSDPQRPVAGQFTGAAGIADERNGEQEHGEHHRKYGEQPVTEPKRDNVWLVHASSQGGVILPVRIQFSIYRRYVPARNIGLCVY